MFIRSGLYFIFTAITLLPMSQSFANPGVNPCNGALESFSDSDAVQFLEILAQQKVSLKVAALKAVKSGDIATLKKIIYIRDHKDTLTSSLSRKIRLTINLDDSYTPDRSTLLLVAVKKDFTDIAKTLIASGANVNVVDSYEMSPLYIAVKNGNAELIRFLSESGAKIFDTASATEPPSGYSQLSTAAGLGEINVVKYLIEQGVEINANRYSIQHYKTTPLIEAAKNNRVEILEILLENGADIDQELGSNAFNVNAIYAAAMANNLKAVNYLISKKASLNPWYSTPLGAACEIGNLEMVRALVNAGAIINAYKHALESPLHTAVRFGHIEIVRFLLQENAWINDQGNFSLTQTPLMVAVKKNNLKMVNELIKHKANVNAQVYHDKATALTYAKREQNKEIINALLKAGARDGQLRTSAEIGISLELF